MLHAVSARSPRTYGDKYVYLLPQVPVLSAIGTRLIFIQTMLLLATY